MKPRTESPMDEHALDRLLSDVHHEVPDGFSKRVMQSITKQPVSVPGPVSGAQAPALPALSGLQWLALVGGGLFGVGQIARIIFGLWFTAAAW